jgi:hypothetical protein
MTTGSKSELVDIGGLDWCGFSDAFFLVTSATILSFGVADGVGIGIVDVTTNSVLTCFAGVELVSGIETGVDSTSGVPVGFGVGSGVGS